MPVLSKRVNKALNEQITREIYSAYLYLGMSAFCNAEDLPGAAHWLRIQWEEELVHTTKLVDYLTDRGGTVTLQAVAQPPAEFGSLLAVFQQVLKHEQAVSADIYKTYEVCVAEKDYAAQTLLQWYIDEQVEEENTASEIVSRLKLAGKDGSALLMIDQQLGQRVAPQPAAGPGP
jgi:ferritin